MLYWFCSSRCHFRYPLCRIFHGKWLPVQEDASSRIGSAERISCLFPDEPGSQQSPRLSIETESNRPFVRNGREFSHLRRSGFLKTICGKRPATSCSALRGAQSISCS